MSNKDTLRKQWQEIWEECYKDQSGQLPGKTIVFAMTQAHALRLLEVFEEMFLQFPGLARVITYKSDHKGNLIDQFKKEDFPRIAITVDLLETGIDVPEVVNLVFMKPVQSRIKLEQMIGRGTRSHAVCLFAVCLFKERLPNGYKNGFLIIDFWENDFNKPPESDGPFGSNLKTDHYTSSGIRVIRLQNIGVGQLINDDKAYISEAHFATLDKHRCLPGDVIVGTLGDPNLRACILPFSIPVALNKADCVQIRVHPDEATAEYICWLLNMPQTLFMATGMIHGQTRTRINMGRLAELQVPIPPLSLQQKFSQVTQKYERLRAQQCEAERQAEHLFQTLLHQPTGCATRCTSQANWL